MSDHHKYTNQLIHSLSPYLQQHAHNPVHWHEWNDQAWEKAIKEDKPVLVSIGYSSCHWCHVMEKESFENEDTASIMNEYFVCIKVDREERPDIDQIYMDAVQLISGHGGWPLNMFCLPDGRPLHGGTYFPNMNWNQLLFQVADLYKTKKEIAIDYAEKLTQGIREMDLVKTEVKEELSAMELRELYETWAKQFDWRDGGNARTPKFPLPNNFLYLLDYGILAGNKEAVDFTWLTLKKMALGGIYDQLGGGFARYSVDSYWLVPHFEKMLYDNGQLLSLYAKMQAQRPDALWVKTLNSTIAFLEKELSNGEGAFYSSYDADSEGIEGKYYVWTWDEIKAALGNDAELVAEYYQCTPGGNWEHGWNILHCRFSAFEFAELKGLDPGTFSALLEKADKLMLEQRNKRIKPGLDDKIILCWNALTLEGLCDAYTVLGDSRVLELAVANADFLLTKMKKGDRLLRIYKNGKAGIPAFLEDYASLCSALIALYQVTFDEKYIKEAKNLADTVITEFYDKESGLFYFTADHHEDLVARKKDLGDDVISSGNAMMIMNLRKLYFYFGQNAYKDIFEKMARSLRAQFFKYPSWYSAWGQYFLEEVFGTYQLSATGEGFKTMAGEKKLLNRPNLLLAGAARSSDLEILANRFTGEDTYYVCRNETCFAPMQQLKDAIGFLEKLQQEKNQ